MSVQHCDGVVSGTKHDATDFIAMVWSLMCDQHEHKASMESFGNNDEPIHVDWRWRIARLNWLFWNLRLVFFWDCALTVFCVWCVTRLVLHIVQRNLAGSLSPRKSFQGVVSVTPTAQDIIAGPG